MNRFDERWKALCRHARTAAPPPDPDPEDIWIALRVRGATRPAPPPAKTIRRGPWECYGLRGFAAAAVVFAFCLAFAFRGPTTRPGSGADLRPGIEDSVAEVFWWL